MLPYQKLSLKEKLQQYGKQQNQVRVKNQWTYKTVYQDGKFDDLYIEQHDLIALSRDNSVLFVASQTSDWLKKFKKRILKFYDIIDNKILLSQIIQSKFQDKSVKSCLFLKDSRNFIIAWENWEIQIWDKKENGVWQIKSIIFATQGIELENLFPLNKAIINKKENLLIISGYGLIIFSRHDNNYCTWNLMDNNQSDFHLDEISYNETEKYLIGQYDIKTIIILEQHKNLKWIFRRKIALEPNLNLLALSHIFLREDSLIYNNRHVLWNKWSSKIIKQKKFHQNQTKNIVCNMLNQIIVLTSKETISIHKLEKNELILYDTFSISTNDQITSNQFTEISNDCRYIIMFREWEKTMYEICRL